LYNKEFINYINNKYFLNYNDDYYHSKFYNLKLNFKEMKGHIELIFQDYDMQEYKEYKE